MKNYHLDLVRVTETGAISAAEWVGRGDKESADKAAVDAMRQRLNTIDLSAEIAIGEGKKDESYGLYEGEIVGYGRNPTVAFTYHENWAETHRNCPQYSIAIDPIEGTTPTAKGGYEAMSVIAMANRGCFFKTEHFYMMKLAVGPEAYCHLDLKAPLDDTLTKISKAVGKDMKRLTVCVLDRPRHANLVAKLRELGCRIKFISDCDVTACIATCMPESGIDVYLGVGGAPEAVIAAAAMKCLGGQLLTALADAEGKLIDDEVYGINDLADGDVMFAATGITDGQLLRGVQFTSRGPVTHSIAMRSGSGTVRRITTEHGN